MPRCHHNKQPKPGQLRSTLNDLVGSSTPHDSAISLTGIHEENRGWDSSFDESAQGLVRDRLADVDTTMHADATLEVLGYCPCGDLDGEAPLVVARRALLVLALLALVSFLAA